MTADANRERGATMTAELPTTIVEMLDALTADRDARVERSSYSADVCGIVMDDAGDGEFWRACTHQTADELVRRGLVRDAR